MMKTPKEDELLVILFIDLAFDMETVINVCLVKENV